MSEQVIPCTETNHVDVRGGIRDSLHQQVLSASRIGDVVRCPAMPGDTSQAPCPSVTDERGREMCREGTEMGEKSWRVLAETTRHADDDRHTLCHDNCIDCDAVDCVMRDNICAGCQHLGDACFPDEQREKVGCAGYLAHPSARRPKCAVCHAPTALNTCRHCERVLCDRHLHDGLCTLCEAWILRLAGCDERAERDAREAQEEAVHDALTFGFRAGLSDAMGVLRHLAGQNREHASFAPMTEFGDLRRFAAMTLEQAAKELQKKMEAE